MYKGEGGEENRVLPELVHSSAKLLRRVTTSRGKKSPQGNVQQLKTSHLTLPIREGGCNKNSGAGLRLVDLSREKRRGRTKRGEGSLEHYGF